MVLNRSAGSGRLNFQRRAYCLNAKSKRSRPRIVSRRMLRPGRRLVVGVGADLLDVVGAGHDRVLGLARHVVDDARGKAARRGITLLPFDLGEVLQEGVDALVHPGPLPLVRVHDHRKEVVTDLVDDGGDQAVLRRSV
jgi:hypothetical protein